MTSSQTSAMDARAAVLPASTPLATAAWWNRDAVMFSAALVALAAILLPLQNQYWVPGGDSEAYLAVARSLALGHGFRFNGQPVSMFPPGWPAVLAAVLHFSTAFLTLKLLTMFCMATALACGYWICRRFCSAWVAAAIVLLCALTTHVFQLTIWLHSDALFALLTALQILAAFWVREKARDPAKIDRADVARAAFLALLCAAAVTVRWAAVLNGVLIAAILLRGLVPRPAGSQTWMLRQWRGQRVALFALLLAMITTLTTFAAWRLALRVTPQEASAANSFNDPSDEISLKADSNISGSYQLVQKPEHGILGYARRLGSWGDWLSYLFWQPTRLGHSMPLIDAPADLAGWALLVLLFVAAWDSAAEGQWIWTAVLVYALALAMNWQGANARYLVPEIFLLLAGIFKGATVLARWQPKQRRWVTAGLVVFVASLLICNGTLWGVEVMIEHRSNFYASYEAGLNRDLIVAGRYLSEIGAGDIQIGVSERYVNLGRIRVSRYPLRALSMLTGRAIVSVPPRYCDPVPPDGSTPVLLNWVRSTHGAPIHWYLFEPDVSPWRVWHFRLGWLQKLHEGTDPVDTGAGWRLYLMPIYPPTTMPTTAPTAPPTTRALAALKRAATRPATTHPTTEPALPPSLNSLRRPVLIDLRKIRPDLYNDPWPTHVPGM